jgi:SPRY domain
MLGVSALGANSDAFLGQDSKSWGLSTNKDLFSGGKKIRTDYGHKLSRTGTIEVTLDTDEGTLSFSDLDANHGNFGVAFNTLKGVSLSPAFSLYSVENSITILTGEGIVVLNFTCLSMHVYVTLPVCVCMCLSV